MRLIECSETKKVDYEGKIYWGIVHVYISRLLSLRLINHSSERKVAFDDIGQAVQIFDIEYENRNV